MLLELSIVPLGRGRSISAGVADLMKIIDASGLDYRLTAAGTIIEGTWDQLMRVAIPQPRRRIDQFGGWAQVFGIQKSSPGRLPFSMPAREL